jgi:hypothetical protein
LSATERTELKLEAPVRNVLVNDICYYNDLWYTIISRYDSNNTLDLKAISGGVIVKDVSIEDAQFRDNHKFTTLIIYLNFLYSVISVTVLIVTVLMH